MARTPEGKVKDAVKEVIAEYAKRYPLRAWWPVPSGYGESTVDCHLVFQGKSFAIETKKYKGKTSALQRKFLREHAAAGGISIVIEGNEFPGNSPRNLRLLQQLLDTVADYDGAATEVFW